MRFVSEMELEEVCDLDDMTWRVPLEQVAEKSALIHIERAIFSPKKLSTRQFWSIGETIRERGKEQALFKCVWQVTQPLKTRRSLKESVNHARSALRLALARNSHIAHATICLIVKLRTKHAATDCSVAFVIPWIGHSQ